MGVYISNMKMLTACFKCRFCTALECFASGKYIKDHYKRNDDCPLVEVKAPHGRLKDVDKILNGEGRYVISFGKDGIDTEEINRAPTIIEAEGKTDG